MKDSLLVWASLKKFNIYDIGKFFVKPHFFYKFNRWYFRFFGWGINYIFQDYNKKRTFCFYSAIKKNPEVKSFAYYYYTEKHTNFLPHTFKWYSFLLYNSYAYKDNFNLNSDKLGLTDFDSLPLKH